MARSRSDAPASLQTGSGCHQRQNQPQKNLYGRQLARVHAPQYHETLFSRLYPGNQQSSPSYLPLVEAVSTFLDLSATHKGRVILRTDAGFGSDTNVNTVLQQGWQVVTKSSGGRRPAALARQVSDDGWTTLRADDRWVARVKPPVELVRPVQWLALRWRTMRGGMKQSALVCSIVDWTPAEVIRHYDDRGACETEIQADKYGLGLARRRKHVLCAQEALVLLTDLAHNLLSWTTPWMFPSGRLAGFGPTQLIHDVLAIPGRLLFAEQQLVEVHLNQLHPYAAEVMIGLERLLDHFGYP